VLPGILTGNSGMALWLLEFSALAGYPVALVFGAPTYLLLRWKGWVALRYYSVAGIAMGALAYFMAFAYGNIFDAAWTAAAFAGQTIKFLPAAALCGVIGTVVFWIIARPDRPWS
jgi:hypothetical protein